MLLETLVLLLQVLPFVEVCIPENSIKPASSDAPNVIIPLDTAGVLFVQVVPLVELWISQLNDASVAIEAITLFVAAKVPLPAIVCAEVRAVQVVPSVLDASAPVVPVS